MDINAIKTFLEVAKTRHFGHAANALFVSQSTVSARIRSLEESIGAELFIRERGNIRLSPSGEALMTYAQGQLEPPVAIRPAANLLVLPVATPSCN